MAAVSMIVYIEECVYIYKKVPANKKSIIIWVNGAAPVSFSFFASLSGKTFYVACAEEMYFIYEDNIFFLNILLNSIYIKLLFSR